MTPEQFITKWRGTPLGEEQGYQLHFRDLCKMLGHPEPDSSGIAENGEPFQFQWSLKKTSGAQGYADVYYGGHFAIEYKTPGKYKDLKDAYDQLLQYKESLSNPPLLAVTDINNWEIHTNFTNTAKQIYRFTHEEIFKYKPVLMDMFFAPERLHPDRNREKVTEEAAEAFRLIADNMRQYGAEPERIAHFVTKLVFCLFAEDVGLLPSMPGGKGLFTYIVENCNRDADNFQADVGQLFQAMADGLRMYSRDIPYFNGALFEDLAVEALYAEELEHLEEAAELDWEAIEPSIFGTLFERSLDPAKRSQLGAHYTSREDILLIIKPVLMQPLRYEWDTVQLNAGPIRERFDKAATGRAQTNARNRLLALREGMLERIRNTKVLDPACGSGNFLYVALQSLMDLEKQVIKHDLWSGLTEPMPEVHPRQMFGIEVNPIAHALASIVVWIGYIQWRSANGYHSHFSEPILEELEGNIVCKDAILAFDGGGNPIEPEWPQVDVIVGNPPFLGDKLMRSELQGEYVDRLRTYYEGRVPGGADLVTYWFENAREHIENGQAKRVGLLATNSIRGGANREVIKRIKETGDIFMAWSDREWILDGAAVRVSMIGFDAGHENLRILDGMPVTNINADLTSTVDITASESLCANEELAFIGSQKGGGFDISADDAKRMLKDLKDSECDNKDVVRPWVNGADIVRRSRDMWIIDFGPYMSLEDARKYSSPFKHVEENVYPARKDLRRKNHRVYWWIHAESRPGMRDALSKVERFICTPRVAKHRLFVWLDVEVLPDSATVAIARDDDYFFGVLHSKLHEVWSLRMGTSLEDRPRYTPTTTFETFPFPWPPGSEDESHLAHARISRAATQLHEERDAWLNPPDLTGKDLKDRTLTNLYNALQVYRGLDSIKVKPAAGDFAPRLDELHRALDEAVCDAYGWEYGVLDDEEEILRRLLELNLARTG